MRRTHCRESAFGQTGDCDPIAGEPPIAPLARSETIEQRKQCGDCSYREQGLDG
jgi:hypothetical protein